jgi:hypothetical protein
MIYREHVRNVGYMYIVFQINILVGVQTLVWQTQDKS